ncbi:MAG: hypothetical protein V2B18_25490 [Pseudomonadota bacterium]
MDDYVRIILREASRTRRAALPREYRWMEDRVLAKTITKKSSDAVGNVRAVADGIAFEGKEWDSFADALNANGVSTTTGKEWTVANIKRFCERNIPDLLHKPLPKRAKRPVTTLRKKPGTGLKEKQPDVASSRPRPADEVDYDGLPRPTSQVKQTLRGGHHIPVFSDPEPSIFEDPAVIPTTNPQARPAQLDEETLAAIQEIVKWWGTGGRAAVTAVSTAKAINYRPVFPGKRKNTGVRINQKLLDDALAKARSPDESTRTGGGLSPLIEFLLWQYLGFGEKYVKS